MAKYIEDAALQVKIEEIEAAIRSLAAKDTEQDGRLDALEEGAQPPSLPVVPRNFQGVWIQNTDNPETAAIRVQNAVGWGGKDLFVFTGTPSAGLSFTNSQGIRVDETLSFTVAEAKRLGVRVWPALIPKWYYRSEFPEQNLGVTDPCVGSRVEDNQWLDLRHPGAISLVVGLAHDLKTNYPDIAGIVLDYTRWSRRWMIECGYNHEAVTALVRAIGNAVGRHFIIASPTSIYGHPENWVDNPYHAWRYGQRWIEEWIGGADPLMGWLMPMSYAGLQHVQWRIEEYMPYGIIPDRVAFCLSPCRNGDTREPWSDDVWRQIIETVYNAGCRGFSLFDERIGVDHPSKMAVLADYWL